MPGTFAIPAPDCYRCPLSLTFPSCEYACARVGFDLIDRQSVGSLAAVIAEPILGTAGCVEPPPGYFTELLRLARQREMLVIFDEAQTGLGRTGDMWGGDQDGVAPDLLTISKTLGGGIPLAATVTAANVNEVTQVFQVLTGMPAVGGKPGRKRQKPDRLQGDGGYDSGPVRQVLRWVGVTPVLAQRKREHGSGLGVFRWFVERTISWLHAFGRLRRRLDRLTEVQQAFLRLACALVCLRFLNP